MGIMSSWLTIAASVAIILSQLNFCYSDEAPNYTFMRLASEAPPTSHYDYIVVGGGTSGCPLAATLSQHSNVLLIERGGSPYGNKNISSIFSVIDTLADVSPTSASQRFVSEDGVVSARARVLGGGTCINEGFYTRAEPDYVKDVGWDGKLVNESYEWVEKAVAFEPHMLQWQTAVRDGLLEVGVTPYNGFTFDHVYGTKVGGTIFDGLGLRHSAANLLSYANPKGLTVILHATVSRILFESKGRSRPATHGVVFQDDAGTSHIAYLNKGSANEIILSAGAIGSPQLLMLSGIGPADDLQALGIKAVVDQPMVGKGMRDNPMNAIYVPSPLPVEFSFVHVVGITPFGSYIEAVSGVNLIPMVSENPTRSGNSQTVQQQFMDNHDQEDADAYRGGYIFEKIIGPLSSGHLKLKNRNPHDNPSITFNYFKEPQDLQRCVHGLKIIEQVIESKAFSKFRYPFMSMQSLINMTIDFPMNHRPKHDNDSTSLEQFCIDTVMTVYHYLGGCQVDRVVDRDYRVLGVDGLRVVDGSTFNFSPGANPQATVMMLGRYMGIKIQTERLGANQTEGNIDWLLRKTI